MGFGKSGSDSINTFAKFNAKQANFVIKNKNADGKWVQSGSPENIVDGTVEGLYPREYEWKGEKKTSFQLILNGNGDPINPDMISIEFNSTRVFGAILPCFTKIDKGDKITLSAKMKGEFANIFVNDSNGELIRSDFDWHKAIMPMLSSINDGSLVKFYNKQKLDEKFGRDGESNSINVEATPEATAMQAAAQKMEESFGAAAGSDTDDDLPF
jgi:hypothetical protein